MFDKVKTRRGKLEDGLKGILPEEIEDVDAILDLVDIYEQDNLDTIGKCKRDKSLELKRINGALKQSIDAHGPINKVLIGSTSKRIYGALLLIEEKKIPNAYLSVRYVVIGLVIGFLIGLIF